MSITVEIANQQQEVEVTEEMEQLIRQVIATCAELLQPPPGEVSVTLVDKQQIQELNSTYRGVDSPTDVLSFAFLDGEEDWLPEGAEEGILQPLGDIVISMPHVLEQAAAYGHSIQRELGFLTVHGFLHLLGYDHQTPEEEQEMFGKQELVLQQMGLTR